MYADAQDDLTKKKKREEKFGRTNSEARASKGKLVSDSVVCPRSFCIFSSGSHFQDTELKQKRAEKFATSSAALTPEKQQRQERFKSALTAHLGKV
jgi:hypothetical protein